MRTADSPAALAAPRRSAFTLVELVVVIGIVAVLAGLTLSGAWYARERARAFRCVTNLHELGVAVALYEKDYGDTLPLVWPMEWYGPAWRQPPLPPQPWATPQYVLGDYISTPTTFVCPDGRRYIFNQSVSGMHVPPGFRKWAGPANTLLMCDGIESFDYGPHLGWGNAVFLDGHVKAYRPPPLPHPPAWNIVGTY
jgi:prepilin-type N-terminal cleavage/methylation domain-containing protein/prepilin-type processing-associated H-X9-DG protein